MGLLMAIAGLVLGIFALVYAFVPGLGITISIPCAVVGLVLSIVGFFLNKRQGKGYEAAIAGMVISISAIVLSNLFNALWNL